MVQLSSMRQRIRAIETIRKITHAMQLISMSTHSRLRQKKEQLEAYKSAFQRITTLVKHHIHNVETSITTPTIFKELYILVGSQKGLSGTFNISIFKFFEAETASLGGNFALITIGKHATDYARLRKIKPIRHYDTFSSLNFVTIAQDITEYILQVNQAYQTVTVYSNYPRTFFIQKPQKIKLLPFQEQQPLISQLHSVSQHTEDYLWEDSPKELYATIEQLIIAITLQGLLFESLLAEQAARFLSMDAATRNAENLLNAMKLEYNKLRQAAITRELTELASSL